MITLKQFINLIDYRITEGCDYTWDCYGPNAYNLSSWNGDHDGHSLNVVFDTEFQTVYEVQVHDYKQNRAYRLIHPDCVEDYQREARERDVNPNEAWDDVDYVDLDVDEDFIEKAQAIIAGEDYDTRVSVPVNFTDEELLTYMKMAHDRDMTFNEFVEQALRAAIDDFKQQGILIQSPPFPADSFTQEQAREAVKKAKKKKRG